MADRGVVSHDLDDPDFKVKTFLNISKMALLKVSTFIGMYTLHHVW